MVPAGYAAVLGVVLFVASIALQAGVSGENLDTDAGLLAQYGDEGSRLVLARIVYGLAWLCFTLPLYTLFTAAQARSERVRGVLVAFCFIGPVLLAIQGPVQAIGLKDAGEKFLEQEPAAEVAEATGSEDAAAENAETKPGEAGAEDPEAGAAGGSTTGEGKQPSGVVVTSPEARRQWAEVRLTGKFDTRVPGELLQAASATEAAADQYIAGYYLWMHHVLSGDGHDDDVGAIEGSFQRAGHVHRARQLESRKKVVVLTVIADGRDHLGLACPQCRGATG